jgi:hypothetical protein
MASTSPSIEICQELNDLFSWNPPPFIRGEAPPRKNESTKTHPPAFFDKHLSDRLLLKHVKRLPSLVCDIANAVDNAIATRRIQLPPAEKRLLTPEGRQIALNDIPPEMEDANAVARYYDKTAGAWCARVASTLAFNSALDWDCVIKWSQSGKFSGYEIADGMLQFISESVLSVQKAQNAMDAETLRLYHMLRKQSPRLATWEFKSLADGSEDTMLAIPKLSNKALFAWTTCSEPKCQSDPKHQRERDIVAKIIPGPDAKTPLWNLNSISLGLGADPMLDESSNPQDSRHEETTKTPLPTALPQPSRRSTRISPAPSQATSFMPPPPVPAERLGGPVPQTDQEGKRRSTRISTATLQATISMPPPPVPAARLGGPVPQTDQKGKRKRDTGDEAIRGPEDVSARCILQQVKRFPFSPDNCSVMLTKHAFRHGRRLYCRIRPSLCSIQGITKSFVFASGALRRFTFLTFSRRSPVRILHTGSFMSGYTSPPSKMPWIG